MTNIENAIQQVESAKKRLEKAYSDNYSIPSIAQFERTWNQHGTGSEQAERLEFVADREQKRISKEVFDAKNNLAHAEMLLRIARAEEEENGKQS